MLTLRDRNKMAAVKDKYQQSGEFREYVGRYVTQFQGLLEQAKKRDHNGVLGATFLSSDLGKLYLVLARALGRDL